MKKIFAMLLAVMMVFSLATVAFADETPADMATVTITKNYVATDVSTVSPAETFSFTVTEGAKLGDDETLTYVTDSTVENAANKIPQITNEMITAVVYNEGAAGQEATDEQKAAEGYDAKDYMTQDITITLPTYDVVGIYYYTIKETAGTTAGVTYHPNEIMLKVTVVQDDTDGNDGKVRVAAVHTETEGTKSDEIENKYSAAKLDITKKVTGNLGDEDKYFMVTVAFESDKPVNAPIYVSGGSKYGTDETKYEIKAYDAEATDATGIGGWKYDSTSSKYTATTTIEVKDTDTVTFDNIPYGVKYTVTENDYTSEQYYSPSIALDSATVVTGVAPTSSEQKIFAYTEYINAASTEEGGDATDDDAIEITNHKEAEVDTGIALDSMPYVLILAVAMGGLVLFTTKKRVQE